MTGTRTPIVATPEWVQAVSRAGGRCETTEGADKRCGALLRRGEALFLCPDGVLRCDPCAKKYERAAISAKRAQARAALAAAQDALF